MYSRFVHITCKLQLAADDQQSKHQVVNEVEPTSTTTEEYKGAG